MAEQFKMNMPDAFLDEAQQAEELRMAEQARLEQIQQQQQVAAQQQEVEQPVVEEPQQQEEENTFLSGAIDHLVDTGSSFSGAPIGSKQLVLAGGIDQVVDTASFLVPWLKPVDDWWEEASHRKETTGWDKAVRDIGGFLFPMMAARGLALKGVSALANSNMGARIGMTGLTKGLGGILTNIGVTEGIALGLSATNDNTREAGNVGTLIETASESLGLGIQVPWASRDSDSEDVIYQKNMFEEAALSGVSAILDLTFSKYGIGQAIKPLTTVLKPKDELSKAFVESSSLGTAAKAQDPIEKITFKEMKREAAQTDEAVNRMVEMDQITFKEGVNPAPEPEYDAFINEPHVPPDRAMQDVDADPIAFKAGVAKIQNNAGTVNGRPRPAVTDHFKDDFLKAKDGTERADMLAQVAEGLAPSFDVVVGTKRIPAEDVNKSIDNLVTAAFGEPEDFAKEFSKLKRDTITIYGNTVNPISDDAFEVATGAFQKFFDLLDPNLQRASASIVTQAGGNVADAARASELIADNFRTTRQQELAFNALKTLLPEIRANQFISGKKLQLKNLIKDRKAKGLSVDENWFEEQRVEFDTKLQKAKQEAEDFAFEALKITRENPKFFAPLMREFIKTNGDVNSIDKLSRLAIDRISFWKKAFINNEPEIPSMLVEQLKSARYNHVLTGMAPIRAVTGAATGLIGKPVTAFVGAAARGDMADFKRSMYVYGGVKENFKKAFKVMSEEWKYALEAPDAALARGRKDFADTTMEDMQTMEEMAEIWEENGEIGKVAVWNMTRLLGNYNKNPVVRFGLNAMGAIDGFSKSMSASMSANARAYDELFETSNGAINAIEFEELSHKLYRKSFDSDGVLKDDIANQVSGEINLNLDSELVNSLEGVMRRVPVAKAIFMFPRTGVNAIQLAATFTPTGILGQSIGRARKVLNAKTQFEIDNALVSHGYKPGNNEAFNSLKSEYVGRQFMGGSVVMGAALWAMEGNLTGSGPSDNAEMRRMRSMGWEPFSIRDPISGEWRSYQGLEPFDTFLGLTADIVYNAQRFDQAVTEDWFRTLASSISLNIAQKTFLSGFEPLAKMISGDQGGLSRFFAMQADSMIPGTGVRSILNKALAPGLKDIEYNFQSYLANRNKFIPFVGNSLANEVDVYTGKPINYTDPMNAAINSVLPFFKTNGGMEPWRQKLIRSGWDNLQTVRVNRITGEQLTPQERNWINTYIGKNLKLGEQIEELFNRTDGWWDKKMAEYVKKRGLNKQADYPIKKTLMYDMLDTLHNNAFNQAFDAMTAQNTDFFHKGLLKDAVNQALQQGDMGAAKNNLDAIQQMPK